MPRVVHFTFDPHSQFSAVTQLHWFHCVRVSLNSPDIHCVGAISHTKEIQRLPAAPSVTCQTDAILSRSVCFLSKDVDPRGLGALGVYELCRSEKSRLQCFVRGVKVFLML